MAADRERTDLLADARVWTLGLSDAVRALELALDAASFIPAASDAFRLLDIPLNELHRQVTATSVTVGRAIERLRVEQESRRRQSEPGEGGDDVR